MVDVAVVDVAGTSATPIFKWLTLENVHKSEQAGHKVMEQHEMVEVRIAGDKNYIPHLPAHSMWKMENGKVITYAERWAEQYRAFKEGNPQEAAGTPLEMLSPYGVTPEQLSLCRALRIYSIETLYNLEGPGVKAMGMNGNALKEAARRYMADNTGAKAALNEVEALKARIAELEGRSTIIPVAVDEPEVVDAVIAKADASMSDEAIKAEIKRITGTAPRGNPSSETLRSMLAELTQE